MALCPVSNGVPPKVSFIHLYKANGKDERRERKERKTLTHSEHYSDLVTILVALIFIIPLEVL